MISEIIFSKSKKFGPLSNKKFNFEVDKITSKFIILYGRIGSGKTIFLNCFSRTQNYYKQYKKFFSEYKEITRTFDYELKKKLMYKKCYCNFLIVERKRQKKYLSFYPYWLNQHKLYPASTLSKDGKNRQNFENFIYINFSNRKNCNYYTNIKNKDLFEKLRNVFLITFEEPIWWLLYVINILYGVKLKKNKLYSDDKNNDWVEKTIFKKLNDYLKEIDLEILRNLRINSNDNGIDYISLQFKKKNDIVSSEQLSCGEWQYVITILFLIIRVENCSKKNKNPVVFFDQPEDNLDPLIQTKLIRAIIDICPEETQFFIATHSPSVSSEIINRNPHNCLLYDFNRHKKIPIVRNKNDLMDCNSFINYSDNSKEIYISLHEINYLIFSISSFDYFMELYYKILRTTEKLMKTSKKISESGIMKNFIEKFNFENEDFSKEDIEEIINFRHKKCHIHFTKDEKQNNAMLIKKYIEILRKILLKWDKLINKQ